MNYEFLKAYRTYDVSEGMRIAVKLNPNGFLRFLGATEKTEYYITNGKDYFKKEIDEHPYQTGITPLFDISRKELKKLYDEHQFELI